jgi:hypothetical protein
MHRQFAIAAAIAALLTASAIAQHRGGVSSGFATHSGSSSRASAMVSHAPAFASSPHSGTGRFGNTFRRQFVSNGFRRRRFFSGFSPWFYYGYPAYYGYPWSYFNYSYLNPTYSYPDYDMAYGQSNAIEQQEIDRLEGEVDRLQEERDGRASGAAAEAKKGVAAQASEPTVLVFRDQHREDVQNYAIVGETVWVFSEFRARKIPLAELDIDTTRKVNEDRGGDFQVPD